MAKNSLLEHFKWYTLIDIAEDYEHPCDTAEDFKKLTEIMYQDLLLYDEDSHKS